MEKIGYHARYRPMSVTLGQRCIMTTKMFYLAITASLLTATALTPARAADMSFERALAAEKEPAAASRQLPGPPILCAQGDQH